MRPKSSVSHDAAVSGPFRGRRQFLAQAAGGAALGTAMAWLPAGTVSAASAGVDTPARFPAHIALYLHRFKNWAQDVVVDRLLSCAPRSTDELLEVVNWAKQAGWKVRPLGYMHNWSPLTVAPGQPAPTTLLVDLRKHLNNVSINTSGSVPTVTAQTGVEMQALLTRMEAFGLGFTATPAPGDLTLGGVLAINGHGTAVPAKGEKRQIGQSYGSLSNAILALTAVVYEPGSQRYVLQSFQRNDPAIAPLLTHVGRALIVSVTLQAGRNQRLRCKSFTHVSATELFAPPGSGGRTFASYVESTGRVEAIWFPFTEYPWMKTWELAPTYPWFSRPTTVPFNYIFSDNLPTALSNLASRVLSGEGSLTPAFGALQASVSTAGLLGTLTTDLWGWSKNLLLYVKPTTLRVTANGYAIVCRRADIQRVVYEFSSRYRQQLDRYRARGSFPANGPVEIRVTGLDQPSEVALPGAVAPGLSALRPRPDHPDWDVAVWLDVLTLPGTPGLAGFYREMEAWILDTFQHWCDLRVEWSKGWGYSQNGAWDSNEVLTQRVPNAFRSGQSATDNWDAQVARLHAHDPYRLFSAPLHARLFG